LRPTGLARHQRARAFRLERTQVRLGPLPQRGAFLWGLRERKRPDFVSGGSMSTRRPAADGDAPVRTYIVWPGIRRDPPTLLAVAAGQRTGRASGSVHVPSRVAFLGR
jgi:hypothetical protein